MVIIFQQNIPSEYDSAYISNLQKATTVRTLIKYGQGIYGQFYYGGTTFLYVRERYPFRIPSSQGQIY